MQVTQFLDLIKGPLPRPRPPVMLELAAGIGAATQEILRRASDGRREAICLWVGRASLDGQATISHLIEPLFESTEDFLTVSLEERALVADYLRTERLLLFADVHTHPHDAFLSSLDRARPFSARDGLYAAVVPEFARGEFAVGWRLYEMRSGAWNEVEVGERILA